MNFELIFNIVYIFAVIDICLSTKKYIWNRDKFLYVMVCLMGVNYILGEIINIVDLYK